MAQQFAEIANRRRYEYRYVEDGRFTGWQNAGVATPETLAAITKPLTGIEYQYRTVTEVAYADSGLYAGTLILAGSEVTVEG